MGRYGQDIDFDGAPPTSELVRDKLAERLGCPVELIPGSDDSTGYQLQTSAQKPRFRPVSIALGGPTRLRLRSSLGRTLIWETSEVLVSLGGRIVPFITKPAPKEQT